MISSTLLYKSAVVSKYVCISKCTDYVYVISIPTLEKLLDTHVTEVVETIGNWVGMTLFIHN